MYFLKISLFRRSQLHVKVRDRLPSLGRLPRDSSRRRLTFESAFRSIEPTTKWHASITLCFHHQDDNSLSDSQHAHRVHRSIPFEHAALGRDILDSPTQCQLCAIHHGIATIRLAIHTRLYTRTWNSTLERRTTLQTRKLSRISQHGRRVRRHSVRRLHAELLDFKL
jgi:hypothetical protein